MTAVVDASIVIRLLTNRESDELLRRRFFRPDPVHAPHLIDAEVASGIRGLMLGKKTTVERAEEMLTDFSELPIVRHSMSMYLPRVLELRDNFTAYDACYVAVAEVTGYPLLTRDARFQRAVGHAATVQVCP